MCEVILACGCLDLRGSPDCYFDSGAEMVTKSIISYRTGRPKLRNWSSMLAFRLVYCCFCVSSCDIPGDICWASGCYTVHAAGYTHSPHVSKQAMRSQFFKITLFCSFRQPRIYESTVARPVDVAFSGARENESPTGKVPLDSQPRLREEANTAWATKEFAL
ncbi:hypothetical protein IG631_05775 [Alternaria alternata]|nr:hypothetical protein IG631_05775 [Alternaria alternata]